MTTLATPKLVMGIAATMVAIYSADQFLARLEQRELDAQARHEYQSGMAVLNGGHDTEAALTQAIAAFRRARTLDRDDPAFQLALADALVRDHQPQRAVDTLTGILEKDSNDGNANLLMARAMNEEQLYSSANAYYHRAIYGTWPRNAEGQQTGARVELVHWLAKRGDEKGLMSELILLEPLATSNKNASLARDLPFLYRQAGSPVRAIAAYRNWLRDSPNDADAYAGLAETEMETGNFRAARQAFERAAELKPGDAAMKQHAGGALRALELDPTPRGLSSAEKLARSTQILNLAVSTASQCPGVDPEDSPMFQNAQKLLGDKKPAVTNEAAETRLNYAQTIWNTRPGACAPQREDAELLSALMRKLAQ